MQERQSLSSTTGQVSETDLSYRSVVYEFITRTPAILGSFLLESHKKDSKNWYTYHMVYSTLAGISHVASLNIKESHIFHLFLSSVKYWGEL